MRNPNFKEYNQYFENLSKNFKPKPVQSINKITSKVSDLLYQEIQVSKLQMPKKLHQKELKYPVPVVEEKPISNQDLLKKVESEKKNAQSKVRQLEDEQVNLRKKIIGNSPKKNSQFKSVLTEQDKQKLRNLIKQSKNHQRSLRKKNREIKKMQRERSMDDMKSEEKMNEERRKLKRKEVLEKMKSMQLKSAQRNKQFEKSQQLMKEVSQKRYLYDLISERQREQKQEKAYEYEQKINEIKQRMKFDIKEIEEHQRNYEQKLNQYRQKMESRVSDIHHRSQSYGQNQFRSLVLSRIEQERIQQYNRLNRGHQMKEKICKYLEEINEKHKPKISKKSKFSLPIKKSSSVHVLSSLQQRLQGLQNLQKAKKLKDMEKQKQRRRTLAAPKTKLEPAYIDYAKSIKVKPYETVQSEFNSLLKKSNGVEDYDQAKKAIILAQRIEAKSRKSKDQVLVSSVKHKLKILEALQNE